MVDVNTEALLNTLLDNKYQLGCIIGKGGMGLVFEGKEVATGRSVAVKCLRPRLIDDSTAVRRFQQEAQLAGTIGNRENICEVMDFGTNDAGIPYLVMPLLIGISLESLFQSRILTLDRLVEVVRQTLNGLSAAHDARIVHRDLKPGNIFVAHDEENRDLVKLLDFGISKILNQENVLELTRTGAILGTPHYMSPEQASGMSEIDHRADIYSVGVILYEGLTGRCPFDGDSYNEIIAKIVGAPYIMPRRLNPLIPAGIEKVVLTAMARDPLNRFKGALEMADALTAALSVADMDNTSPITSSVTAAKKEGEVFRAFSAPVKAAKPSLSRINLIILIISACCVLATIAVLAVDISKKQSATPMPSLEDPVPSAERNANKVSHVNEQKDPEPSPPRVTIPLFLPSENEEENTVNHSSGVKPRDRSPKQDTTATTRKNGSEFHILIDSPKSVSPLILEQKEKSDETDTESVSPTQHKKRGIVKRGMTFVDQYDD